MLKKMILPLVVCALLVGALSACKGAQEAAATTLSKDAEQMMETATLSYPATAGQTLRESLGVPAAVEEDNLPTKLDQFSVSISADVIIPDSDHLSVYRVSAAEFPQAFVARAFDYFCGGQTMYDYGNLANNKEQIQGLIDSMQNDLDKTDSPDGTRDDAWRAEYEAQIAELKPRLQTSREDLGDPITSATLSEQDGSDGGKQTVFEAVNATNPPWTKEFYVRNNARYPVSEGQTDAGGESAVVLRSEASIHYFDSSRVAVGLYQLRDVTNETQIAELSTTPAQAKEQAAAIFNALGIADMKPYRVTLAQEYTEDGTAGKFAYFVEARRTVGGVEVQSPFNRTYVGSFDGGKEWAYETLEVRLDDDGLLGFSWVSPLSVEETEVERANLLPFSSILNVAKNMLGVVNEPHESVLTDYSAYEIKIDQITLSLQRISDVNSIETGLLIPVWNFYGTQRFFLPDGTEQQSVESYPVGAIDEALLSVNAIDGSVISKAQGF